ncbi:MULTISPECIES: nucleotidyltransferase domain-containing protein [unclassified Bradyrhizobium]|uniref:nucleotidyltransferase domain-containing protein n=1 Tax=unclassified Bradyrhizobium TaxID=2631580 RepID=UPI0024789AEE|nr:MULTISPECIES: nucleotidyltransferase domain-containing protein [unclassified Bradyrhizobium]WGR69328.1 nucleotidyltransferase domain-containing protein [Bradyrhizobium sp. ISRA426]WGR81383.1 nucleotidyltransferase domain-containing protein [Bradyrhizobium sp. ISRA430]WGR84567.1 nucleotidyltransferase domain-containing protein [Bradyrhizobium sp. ISRA432]
MAAQTDIQHDPLIERLTSTLGGVAGVEAIVLGGSRARGTSHENSDYDIGLYFSDNRKLDTDRLQQAARQLADDPEATTVTSVGEWGPWIVGGAWLTIEGQKVDLLYRNIDAVRRTMEACRAGQISMDYQPGHPHGFCSAIWMGEIACCQALRDERAVIAELKSIALPYPQPLRDALIQRFRWEILFSIENAELAALREDQVHVAGCAYRALACIAQVLFALNGEYLINEKAALQQAAEFPLTIPDLMEQTSAIWRRIGNHAFGTALLNLRTIDRQLKTLTQSCVARL